jgi:uncharacterized protein YggE
MEKWNMRKNLYKLSSVAAAAVLFVHLSEARINAAAILNDAQQTQGAPAQTDGAGTNAKRLPRVTVAGESVVQAQPDTAILSISVVTQNRTALAAQQDNANKSEAVIRAVKAVAGAGAEVKTGGYSLQPQRVYKENQPPTIVGYEARNTVTATLGDLTKVGAVIDAASQAGANNIDGIAFTLRKDLAARTQALAEAARQAMTKAQVIAQAIGARVVRIVDVQEANTIVRPLAYDADTLAMAKMSSRAVAPTPIEIGTLDIRSQVQLTAEIEAAP